MLPSNSFFGATVRGLVVLLACSQLSSCTFLSNREYVQNYAAFQGTHRIAVFLQRWPVYLQTAGRNSLGDDFIKPNTYFYGPWQPAGQINPRALDIRDIDDGLVSQILIDTLRGKGYQVFLSEVPFGSADSLTVKALMAQYRAFNPYSRRLFIFLLLSDPISVPCPDHAQRSCREVLWTAGDHAAPRAGRRLRYLGGDEKSSGAIKFHQSRLYLYFSDRV